MKNLIPNKNTLYTSIGFLFIFMGFNAAQQYLLPLLKIQGRENEALTSLILIYGFFLISSLIVPRIINLLGLKISIISGALTYIFFSLSVISNSVLLLNFTSILLGFGASFLWISSAQIITDSSAKNEIGKNLGFQLSSLTLGTILGLTMATYLVEMVSLVQLYLILSSIIILGLLFFLPLSIKKKNIEEKKFQFKYFFKIQLILLIPIIFASQFFAAQTFAAMNLIILGLFGLSFIGILAIIYRISSIIGGYSTGKFSDKYDKKRILLLMTFSGLLGSILFIFTSNIVSVTLGIICLGVFSSGSYPLCLSLLKQSYSDDNYLYIVGAFNFISSLGILSALFATKYFSPQNSFIPGIILLIISLLILYFLREKISLKTNE